jgi:hypothetical protein
MSFSHSSFVIRHSSFVIRHSSFVIRHSVRHSSFPPALRGGGGFCHLGQIRTQVGREEKPFHARFVGKPPDLRVADFSILTAKILAESRLPRRHEAGPKLGDEGDAQKVFAVGADKPRGIKGGIAHRDLFGSKQLKDTRAQSLRL